MKCQKQEKKTNINILLYTIKGVKVLSEMAEPNIHIKIPEELDKKLRDKAEAEFRTKASIIRQLISEMN